MAAPRHSEPGVLTERVVLPPMVLLPDNYCDVMGVPRGVARWMASGYYDRAGNLIGTLQDNRPGAPVIVEYAGVTFVWAVFAEKLGPGCLGEMIFENCPGTAPITSFFNEWNLSTGLPEIGDGLFELFSSQRGRNIAKVSAVNRGRHARTVAAGFIVSAAVEMPLP